MTAVKNQTSNTSVFETKTMAKIAILGAVAFILMLFEFPLPVAPNFYKFDFSEVAVLIGAFALGPAAAAMIEAIKVLLNILFNGTITMGVGELANFLIGCAFVVPAGIMYRKKKTKKGAMISMALGTVCMMIAGVILNYFVLLPAFVSIAKFPLDMILSAGQAIFPFIRNTFQFVLACVTPFNLIKGIAVSVVTALIYKHVSPLLKR